MTLTRITTNGFTLVFKVNPLYKKWKEEREAIFDSWFPNPGGMK